MSGDDDILAKAPTYIVTEHHYTPPREGQPASRYRVQFRSGDSAAWSMPVDEEDLTDPRLALGAIWRVVPGGPRDGE